MSRGLGDVYKRQGFLWSVEDTKGIIYLPSLQRAPEESICGNENGLVPLNFVEAAPAFIGRRYHLIDLYKYLQKETINHILDYAFPFEKDFFVYKVNEFFNRLKATNRVCIFSAGACLYINSWYCVMPKSIGA